MEHLERRTDEGQHKTYKNSTNKTLWYNFIYSVTFNED
jgi:hypothetical protein